MISHTHQFIFVHLSRTGGSSLERAAGVALTTDPRTRNMGNTDFADKHQTLQYYHDAYPEEFRTFFKFTIVRNPFDRLVSAWLWRTRFVCDMQCNLEEFICTRPEKWTYTSRLSLKGMSPLKAIRVLDFVGRFEDIAETYSYVCSQLRIKRSAVTHTNRTLAEDYRRYYTPSMIDIVNDRYRQDLELFGYQF